MTMPNGDPKSGAPAPTPPAPAATAAAPSASAPAPAPAAPSSGGGGGSDAAYWKAEFEKARADRDALKGKVRDSDAEAHEQILAEKSALEQQLKEKADAEAKALGELQERNRMDVRRHFVDAILARVPEGQKTDVDLRLAGLEQKGELAIPDELPENATPEDLRKLATESAGEALTQLVDRYPGWFAGGSAGVGTPVGPGGGPMPEDWMALPEETRRNMSDEDFEKYYGSKRPKKKRRTLMG